MPEISCYFQILVNTKQQTVHKTIGCIEVQTEESTIEARHVHSELIMVAVFRENWAQTEAQPSIHSKDTQTDLIGYELKTHMTIFVTLLRKDAVDIFAILSHFLHCMLKGNTNICNCKHLFLSSVLRIFLHRLMLEMCQYLKRWWLQRI